MLAKLGVAKPILNQAQGISPAGFFAFFQTPAIQKQSSGEKQRKNHESTDSTQNNFTTSDHTGACLLRAFTRSAGGRSTTRWRLWPARLWHRKYCRGRRGPS